MYVGLFCNVFFVLHKVGSLWNLNLEGKCVLCDKYTQSEIYM